jgi:hypothetical protein
MANSNGNLTDTDKAWMQAQIQGMSKNMWRTASGAGDDAIIALGRQEIAVDETLQRETIGMCASRGQPLWDLNALPSQSLREVQRYGEKIGLAYLDGKTRQTPLVTNDQATSLFQQAVASKEAPLSNADVTYLISGDRTDQARTCRVRLQFERNVLAIPQSASLLRWLYANQ